jgi:hypothetical protein
VNLIDFRTPFLDKRGLMPDGIHPLVEGSDLIARILYKELTGNAIDSAKEKNAALHAPAFQGNSLLSELTDGNDATIVALTSVSEPVIVHLVGETVTDMIQMNLTDSSSWSSVSFTLSVSVDSLAWLTVADTTIVDTSLHGEHKVLKFAATFQPISSRYVRFSIKENGIPDGSALIANGIKVFESRVVHAPIWGWKFVSQTSQSIRVRLFPERTTNKGEIMKIFRQSSEGGPYTLLYNYGAAIPPNLSVNITVGTLNRFYCAVYYSGAEIVSDTLTVLGERVVSVHDEPDASNPLVFRLSQNFPNPFNPTTTISYYVPRSQHVEIAVFDILGNEIASLVKEFTSAGLHTVKFSKGALSSGIYFYRLSAKNVIQVKKLVLLQ